MSRDLIVTLRSIGLSISGCALFASVITGDLTWTLLLACAGIVLIGLTLGEK